MAIDGAGELTTPNETKRAFRVIDADTETED
jgi:hypothetical protein